MAKEKKGRKFGRNKKDAQLYQLEQRLSKNRRLRAEKLKRETAKRAARSAWKKANPGKKWGEQNTTIRNEWRLKFDAPKLGPATS